MSEYEDALAALPSGGQARGVTTVLIRISTHLGYMIAHITDQPLPEGEVTPADSPPARLQSDLDDITEIRAHGNSLVVGSDTISRATNNQLIRFLRLINTMGDGWNDLTDDLRRDRLTDIANRLAYTAAMLDVELAALPADAGAHV